jgi:hypothetical protein
VIHTELVYWVGLRVVAKEENPIQLRDIAELSGVTVQFVFNLTRPCINMVMRRSVRDLWLSRTLSL